MEPRLPHEKRNPSIPSESLCGLTRTEEKKEGATWHQITVHAKYGRRPGVKAGGGCAVYVLSLVMTLWCHQQQLVCLFLIPGVHISPRPLVPCKLDKAFSRWPSVHRWHSGHRSRWLTAEPWWYTVKGFILLTEDRQFLPVLIYKTPPQFTCHL